MTSTDRTPASPAPPRPRRWWRSVLALVAVGALVIGLVLVARGLDGSSPPPAPAPAAAAQGPLEAIPAPPAAPTVARPDTSSGPLAPSRPVSIAIPSIGVSSPINVVGLNPDRTVQVPAPGPLYDQAAWFSGSVTPGELGPSVVLGHVDSARNGPSVFYRLGQLRPGSAFTVTRTDGSVLAFRVDGVRAYPKNAFPTETVYGGTVRPELRLITCGGSFDSSARSYRDNTVVFAHLLT